MEVTQPSNMHIQEDPQRVMFVTFKSWRTVKEKFGSLYVFTYTVRYRRFAWDIHFTCVDMIRLARVLYPLCEARIPNTRRPIKFNKVFYKHDQASLHEQSLMMLKYLQDLFDIQSAVVIKHTKLNAFLGISAVSFNPANGRKGKEGWLKKLCGGNDAGPSGKIGGCFRVWKWRWVVLHDTCISWFKCPKDAVPRGIMQLGRDFRVAMKDRVLTITTGTRSLFLSAHTTHSTEEWHTALTDFYRDSSRVVEHPFQGAYPPRNNCEVKVYTYTRDYFVALAKALLTAQKEIFITSWVLCPTLLLTRPPFPTLRLDQILKYKAERGIKIYVLLYKEVEHTGQEHDSLRAKTYLENLHSNIYCIRHPNKVTGSSTAVIWSHHEKSVVIDRNLCFIGGVDLAFTRWDDEKHSVTDEDGTKFPGLDYHNPAPDLFKPPQQSTPVSPEIDANSAEINGNGDNQEQPNDHQEHPLEPRDLYPRMPWHDVQACVSGLTARDCAAHFVQRWNHHRISASHTSKPILFDITDNPNYGVCARCQAEDISEPVTKCTDCGHDLGPGSAYSAPTDPALCPESLEHYSYILFKCTYQAAVSLPFSTTGDSPVMVTAVKQAINLTEGVLVKVHGEQAEQLQAVGLAPIIGDVIVAVDDKVVTQLDSSQLARLLGKMQTPDNAHAGIPQDIRFTFRRHFLQTIHSVEAVNDLAGGAKKPTVHALPARALPYCVPLCHSLVSCVEASTDYVLGETTETQLTCQAAARAEELLSMSTLFHTLYPNLETLPRVPDASGTCNVQLLRSIGTWSTGARTECSIQNCYVDTIASAKHFIYIENQYFISGTAGEDVSNTISAALTKRILHAHHNNEAFRVVVVVPIHPDDDFVNKFIPQAVMHYQYLTINRGVRSMFAQLQQQAPDIAIADYISFYSLRNWGVINHSVVSEQVYVHAKLMIVDDRVAIIGSANINDRSMLGLRDSELALRIEDTKLVSSTIAGEVALVGRLPHMLRMRLMQQHLGEDTKIDLSDPLSTAVYEAWTSRATANSAIYDEIDGDMSVYRCTTVPQYKEALKKYVNLNYQDNAVQSKMEKIKGFLINWPLTLFENEDLSPPLAPRLFVPVWAMTNYSKWDKFDPDMVCMEIEKQQAVESSKTAKKKVFQAIASENEQSIMEAKRNAEALQSQADVAALKARGGMGGRRKTKAKDDGPKDTENADSSVQPAPPAPPKARTLADRLHAITDFLFKLLKQVEQIRVCTEKKQSHDEGYIASIRCLQDIHVFSRIKNATVMAALRATATNATPAVGDKGTAPHRPDATVKIIEDLNESESFLIEQTINCLSLFALSRGEFALSVECARYVLKRQGDHADAGIWIMRGLALAALGAPYLTKLHCASANTVNSDYAGLKECSAVVEMAVVAHARQTVKCDRQELVSREVAHSVLSFFSSKAHLLQAIPDLAVITSSEVNNMLQEGSVHTAEVTALLAQMDGTEKDPMARGESKSIMSSMAADVSSLHVDEDRSHAESAAETKVTSVGNVSCDAIAGALLQCVASNTIIGRSAVSSKTVGSPFSTLLNAARTLLQPMALDSEHLHNVLVVLAGLNIVRKLFYEAQVLYLESIYQTAEIKYSAAILLINSLLSTLVALEGDTPGAVEDSNISQLLSQGLLLNPTNNADQASGVMKWADVKLYMQRLQSACFTNIATCMCQHSVKLNMIVPSNAAAAAAAAAAATTTVTSSVSIASVAHLVSPTSAFTTPLHYVSHGLKLLDSLSGRFRKIFVLEKMHRFSEGLTECQHIQGLLKNKDYTSHTGSFVAHDLSGSGLGQEYLPGFVLPMPVASVLAQNDRAASTAFVIEPVDEVQKTEADLLLETEFDAITGAGGNDLSFHAMLSCACTASDEVVKTQVWQRQLQKKIEMFEFLIRKHGVK